MDTNRTLGWNPKLLANKRRFVLTSRTAAATSSSSSTSCSSPESGPSPEILSTQPAMLVLDSSLSSARSWTRRDWSAADRSQLGEVSGLCENAAAQCSSAARSSSPQSDAPPMPSDADSKYSKTARITRGTKCDSDADRPPSAAGVCVSTLRRYARDKPQGEPLYCDMT